jgi:hypothetical protein
VVIREWQKEEMCAELWSFDGETPWNVENKVGVKC